MSFKSGEYVVERHGVALSSMGDAVSVRRRVASKSLPYFHSTRKKEWQLSEKGEKRQIKEYSDGTGTVEVIIVFFSKDWLLN